MASPLNIKPQNNLNSAPVRKDVYNIFGTLNWPHKVYIRVHIPLTLDKGVKFFLYIVRLKKTREKICDH